MEVGAHSDAHFQLVRPDWGRTLNGEGLDEIATDSSLHARR